MRKIKIEDLPETTKLGSDEIRRAFGGGIAVFANNLSIVHKRHGGLALGFPDICLAPPSSSGGPVPIPYPNFGSAADTMEGGGKTK
jgi:hypothetical protein